MNRLDWLAATACGIAALAATVDKHAARVLIEEPTVADEIVQAAGDLELRETRSIAPACDLLHVELPQLIEVPDLDRPVPSIEDPSGEVLAPFYTKLAGFLRGKAKDHLRIGVYADSNGTKDYMTGEMRRYWQSKYGDAGHGFIALAKPWSWYIHRDVQHGLMEPYWQSHAVSTNWTDDGYYGHGLIAGETSLPNVSAWVETAKDTALVGKTISDVEVYYLKRPGGGRFDVLVDGDARALVDTEAANVGAGFLRLALPDQPHRIECVTRDKKPVRLLGAILERAVSAQVHPSIVVDALSVGGASWRTMLREDPELDRETLQHRGYDLVILHMGTNSWRGELYRRDKMRAVIAHLHDVLPETPILVMDPPDHNDDFELMDIELAPEQRRIAREMGCAFFDFHAAMGGRHSIRRFFGHGMCQGDIVHFNEAGGAYMARRVMYSLFKDFARWTEVHPRSGCE